MSNLEISRAERLDQRVVSQFPELSRMYATKLVNEGRVTVNGVVITKSGHKLNNLDEVSVDYDLAELKDIPEIDLPILYEDDDCVVISKPLGLLTHSKGAFNPEATVATWLRTRLKGMDGERGGIVHRLDRATSGVMICAKTPDALSALQKQFSQRKTKKTYVAIVKGRLKNAEAIIDMPIERNPKKPQTFRVGSGGKSATTAYKVLKTTKHYSLVELKPFSGRTHQLRVHLEELGHPIVGDILYGGVEADRLFLHARELEITIPSRERKIFETPVPASFQEFLDDDR